MTEAESASLGKHPERIFHDNINIMALIDRVLRTLKRGVTNPGVLLAIVLCFLVYQYFYADKVWVMYERVKVGLQLRLSGRYDQVHFHSV